jgi:hypothetical protein
VGKGAPFGVCAWAKSRTRRAHAEETRQAILPTLHSAGFMLRCARDTNPEHTKFDLTISNSPASGTGSTGTTVSISTFPFPRRISVAGSEPFHFAAAPEPRVGGSLARACDGKAAAVGRYPRSTIRIVSGDAPHRTR